MGESSTTDIVIDFHGFPFRVDMLPDNDDHNPEEIDVLMPSDKRITLTGGCEVCSYPTVSTCFYFDANKIEQMPIGFYNFLIEFHDAYKLELKARESIGRKTARFTKRAWCLGMEFFWDFQAAEEAMEKGWKSILSEL